MSAAFSVCYWLFAGVAAVPLYAGALAIWSLTAPFDPARALLHRYTCWWAQLYLRCLPGCRVVVEGREKLAPHTPYILAANHQSAADILALSALAVPFKWVSKKANFYIPLIGWNMCLNGYLRVEPGNPRSVRAAMEFGRSWLRRGVPLLWFPEGRRCLTGELLPFRGGAFRLAVACGCAVVPVVVDGTRAVYRGWRVAPLPGEIRVRVLDPITPAQAGGSAEQLRDQVRDRISQVLAEMRAMATA